MKKILFFVMFAGLYVATNAQTKKKTYTKRTTKTYRYASAASSRNASGNAVAVNANDSTNVYYNLGWDKYKEGDLGAARYYWELATVAPGSAKPRNAAYHRLGLMHQHGEGIEINLEAALDYYKKGAGYIGSWGDVDAIKAVAGCYENGHGTQQNFNEALKWYQYAKKAGNKYCDEDIARVKENIRLIYGQKTN